MTDSSIINLCIHLSVDLLTYSLTYSCIYLNANLHAATNFSTLSPISKKFERRVKRELERNPPTVHETLTHVNKSLQKGRFQNKHTRRFARSSAMNKATLANLSYPMLTLPPPFYPIAGEIRRERKISGGKGRGKERGEKR